MTSEMLRLNILHQIYKGSYVFILKLVSNGTLEGEIPLLPVHAQDQF